MMKCGVRNAECGVRRSISARLSRRGGEGAVLTLRELQAIGVVALTKTQMAGALQISVRSLNGMMARGEISFFRIGSRLVRFRVEDALKRMSETVLVAAEEGQE
jgi:hypothetical protein